MPLENIVVQGAREHNLKDVSVTIPRNKLVVMTGCFGFGQEFPGVRYDLCGGATAVCGVAVFLCAAVPGADG